MKIRRQQNQLTWCWVCRQSHTCLVLAHAGSMAHTWTGVNTSHFSHTTSPIIAEQGWLKIENLVPQRAEGWVNVMWGPCLRLYNIKIAVINYKQPSMVEFMTNTRPLQLYNSAHNIDTNSHRRTARLHLSVFTAQWTLCKCAGLGSRRPSVCPSVCDVGGLWSHRLEILETNCTDN